jgi:hypothetical protein
MRDTCIEMAFIRFAIGKLDEDSRREQGVFHALGDLRDGGHLHWYEIELAAELRDWFNQHLERPARFSTSKGYTCGAQNRAISWFRDSAKRHIAKIREMVAILENHDVKVEMLKTEKPNYIVYEDEFQVVAEPFSDSDF